MPVVKLFATLRKLAGTKEVSVTGATVAGVLNELIQIHPALDGVIVENEQVRPHVIVTMNGYNITDFETPVTEQDHIAVFPPIAGG